MSELPSSAPHSAPRQAALPLAGTTSYLPKDFVITDANTEAYRLVMAWPHWPDTRMILSGPAGSGQTHLAHIWASFSGATALSCEHYAPAEQLLKLPTGSPVWLDNAEQTPSTDLFHLLNLAQERGHSLLLCAKEYFMPVLPDLLSRWRALPKAVLRSPDDALLEAALLKCFADHQLHISTETISYLLPRMPRTLHAANQLVVEMDRLSLISARRITPTLARKALEYLGFS
jgi:chromosomal replication initiation ATPase DnaA